MIICVTCNTCIIVYLIELLSFPTCLDIPILLLFELREKFVEILEQILQNRPIFSRFCILGFKNFVCTNFILLQIATEVHKLMTNDDTFVRFFLRF